MHNAHACYAYLYARPSHLKIPGGPKIARAAIGRRAMRVNLRQSII